MENFVRLYDIVYNIDNATRALYFNIQGEYKLNNGHLLLKSRNKVDFLTYFNSFSIGKWKKYTFLELLKIRVIASGKKNIEIYSIAKNKEFIIQSIVSENTLSEIIVNIREVKGDLLGIRIITETECNIKNIQYLGTFRSFRKIQINAVICTYKREKYIKKNIQKLYTYEKKNNWLHTLVIDNGQTLGEIKNEYISILHNPNYGGSGGFTRGLMECVEKKNIDYVILMDDDIEFNPIIFQRVRAFLGALKDIYKDCFFAGSMLCMEKPLFQYECIAYWNGIRPVSYGRNFDLSQKKYLLQNEKEKYCENQYAAWWFCAIPLKQVKKIGLPLPIFIKGDDIEYSLRNGKEILSLNGVGVWHEEFNKKKAEWINYFIDRNMLMMHYFAKNDNSIKFFIGITLRLLRRLKNRKQWAMLNQAFLDHKKGLLVITSIAANKKLVEIQDIRRQRQSKIILFMCIMKNWFEIVINYSKIKKKYIFFINEMLKNNDFWKKYYELYSK